jgi:bifunctional UDP-N-acetylglucosamine pyrophosphorylase/glucosamine-1-phosphate N-acetyltransferase
MNGKTLVVVVFPDEPSILESEIAGRPAGDYLLKSLNEWNEAEVKVAVDGNNRSRLLLEKFPNMTECRLAEPHSVSLTGNGLLIIDARAWLSHAALPEILSLISSAKNCLRIVESGESVIAAHREVRTLAVYLPPEKVRQDIFVCEHTSEGRGLEHILNAEALTNVSVVTCPRADTSDTALLLVSFVDLAELELRLMLGRAIAAMKQGVRIHDPNRVYIRGDLECGSHVTIEVNVVIEGHVVLGDGVKIGANSILKNCRLGDNTRVNPFSLIEESSIGSGSFVGPYGRIRPGSVIGDNVQIGNYVEIKNSQIGDGSRINHHTFLGDAQLANQVTIGAGTITCNHDGVRIHRTFIERGAYIGSGCNLVAPLRIGEDAVVGAGSTITRDVPAAKLTLARQPQTTIENWQGPKTTRARK